MAGSDNTSSRSLDTSQGNVARSAWRLRLTRKQIRYLEDVAGGLALLILGWLLYVVVGVVTP